MAQVESFKHKLVIENLITLSSFCVHIFLFKHSNKRKLPIFCVSVVQTSKKSRILKLFQDLQKTVVLLILTKSETDLYAGLNFGNRDTRHLKCGTCNLKKRISTFLNSLHKKIQHKQCHPFFIGWSHV